MVTYHGIRSQLEWNSTLSISNAPQPTADTKFHRKVSRPNTNTVEKLAALRRTGVNIGHVIDNTRKMVAGDYKLSECAIKGPKICTGLIRDGKDAGHEFVISTEDKYSEICDNKKKLPKVTAPGKLIYIDDEGQKDLIFGVKNSVDLIFVSFIRCSQGVTNICTVLGTDGANIKIIVKIEKNRSLWQPRCSRYQWRSCTVQPQAHFQCCPDGPDCVMLSGETAKGNYPVVSVLMMTETRLLAEAAIFYPPLYDELQGIQPRPTETVETVVIAAVAAAPEQNASVIIVLSTSGNTARLISKYCLRTVYQIHFHRGCYPF
ncbi:Pyruvate/Phosphoenolpyruvate kinase-like domain-containing protein [Suillus subluteus]|nr:Pyruvate/Phosphoenolpyruvate kinase-like domain-containing protein [Suillus subluteus]